MTTTTEPRYKVYRVMRKSANRKTIENNLTLEQARRLVKSFPDSKNSMVVYTQQLRRPTL